MSCNSNCYLPIPPRAWSRVQNNCSLIDNIQGDNLVQVPYSKKLVPASVLYLEYAMLNKGNVLQYKKNSSNLTKQQRYSQIAKGLWTNRNTTWATQSTRGYTNPNNQSLQRVGSINITLAGVPTAAPVTCPKNTNIVNEPLPPAGSGGSGNPETLPPPPPVTDTGILLPDEIVVEPPVEPIVIQDLGNLVCGTKENVCTGEIFRQPTDIICHPTSDSDVPGPIMELCWNDGTPTWYPRQRYVMSNSGNKWPVNATLLSAIKPLPSDIISVTNIENVVTLEWTFDAKCLPVNDFIIYENGIPVKIVSGATFKTSITVDNCATYTFYIIGTNGNIVSDPSNSVSIDIYVQLPPIITSVTNTCDGGITINWENIYALCFPIKFYTIYQNGSPIAYPTSSPYIVYPSDCKSYSYYIITTYTNGSVSAPSNTLTSEIKPCPVQDLEISDVQDTCLTLTWSNPSSICTILSYEIYQNGVLINYNPSPYKVTGLTPETLYSFYIVSVGDQNTAQSSPVSATTNSNAPTNLSVTTDSCSSGTYLVWTAPTNTCDDILRYNIYNNYIGIINTPNASTSYTIPGDNLICGQNTFYVEAVFDNLSLSLPSNPPVTTSLTPCPPSITPGSTTSTTATINWTLPSTKCHITSYNIYQDNLVTPIGSTSLLSYTAGPLITGQLYTFYVTSVGANLEESVSSNILTVTLYSTPIITTVTYCYKEATISWTNDDPVSNYELYQDSLSSTPIYSGSAVSYPVSGLTNGVTYNFYVRAVYNGSVYTTSAQYSSPQPSTSTYFSSSVIPLDNGTNTTYTFTTTGTTGTLSYNCPTAINNVPLLIVGGGGGGGGGYFFQSTFQINGGGGGGGGEVKNITITIPNETINVTVGSGGGGGVGNNSDGAPGTLSQITSSTTFIQSSPGFGGKIGTNNGGGNGAGGGSGGTSGGAGGYGFVSSGGQSNNGTNSANLSYSGGGGGGSQIPYGGSGGNGVGGIGGGNTTSDYPENGQDGLLYGSGGGGGAGGPTGNGGAGRQGIVIFTIPN